MHFLINKAHANNVFGGVLLNRNVEYIFTAEVNTDQHISFPPEREETLTLPTKIKL